jgi:hypothetical protein
MYAGCEYMHWQVARLGHMPNTWFQFQVVGLGVLFHRATCIHRADVKDEPVPLNIV